MPYLTPDLPGFWRTMSVSIPDTLIPAFFGAIIELTFTHNWEDFGTLSRDDAVSLAMQMLMSVDVMGAPYTFPQGTTIEMVYVETDGSIALLSDNSGFVIGLEVLS